MTASRLTGLFLCSTAIGGVKPNYAPDGASGFGGEKKKPKRSNAFTVLEARMLFDAAGAETVDSVADASTLADQIVDDGSHEQLLAALDAPVSVVGDRNILPRHQYGSGITRDLTGLRGRI